MDTWVVLVSLGSGLLTIIAVVRAITSLKKELKTTIDSYVCSKVKEEIRPLIEMSVSQIRYSIVRARRELIRTGKIGLHDLEAIEEMYEQYKARGGNGFLSKIMKDIEALEPDLDEQESFARKAM